MECAGGAGRLFGGTMEEDYVMIPGTGTKKIIRDVKKEIETAFLDYSMSVSISTAIRLMRASV